ncbi:MAG TPA: hypothetical protein PKD45_06555 [Flavobacteriales bacterium]|nr:hypothetical protein [Flavobacteriales bacterium]
MRLLRLFLLLAWVAALPLHGQGVEAPRPLVLTEVLALPLSAGQVEKAAQAAWEYSFGQEPAARMAVLGGGTGRLEGAARFNFKSSTAGNRLATLGVIDYQVTIQAENGLCRVRISQFNHTGNRYAPGGAVSLGRIYADKRPPERVPGISSGVAQRLNDDMRGQLGAHLSEVIKVFFRQLKNTVNTE